jgi:hypothetical protein
MNGATFAVINNLAHARNRLIELSKKVETVELKQEIAKISETIENAIYNVKSIGA